MQHSCSCHGCIIITNFILFNNIIIADAFYFDQYFDWWSSF